MNRRRFLTFAALSSAARQASAQSGSGKPYRVGFLSAWSLADGAKYRSTDGARYRKLFQDRLADRGFTSDNLEVRYFSADGRIDLLAARAKEVAAWAPNAVFAPGFLEAKAMQTETRTIPIVFCAVSDPVEIGLVRELGRPGGNVTGAAQEYAGLTVKRLELVRELLPRATRVAVLMRSDSESLPSMNVGSRQPWRRWPRNYPTLSFLTAILLSTMTPLPGTRWGSSAISRGATAFRSFTPKPARSTRAA